MSTEQKKNTIVKGVRAKTYFQVLNSVVFESIGRNEKRAQIMKVNGNYFVSISGFWKPKDSDEYIPDGKCIFLNFGQWKSLMNEVELIEEFIVDAINDGILLNTYLNTFHDILIRSI